jgi:hypothetical protein
MIDVLLAAPDLTIEPDLVLGAPAAGLRIMRRCVDAVDLFAAAGADSSCSVIVSAGLPRLQRDSIARIAEGRSGVVVGLAAGAEDNQRLRSLGLDVVIPVRATTDDTLSDVRTALESAAGDAGSSGVWSTGVWQAPTGEPDGGRRPAGQLVVVWGPAGAPGRTTVAIGLAEQAARTGSRTCLVDADTYAPSVTMALGLVEDASGLIVACRHADNATLGPSTLASCGHAIRPGWSVVGGIGRPERWVDLRRGALDRVWAACRSAFDVTVVDIGFCIEAGDDGAWGQRRNDAALTALAAADHVVAVADASPLGAARLVAGWGALAAAAPSAGRTVVQNRSGGRHRDRRTGWSRGLRELGIPDDVVPVPDDPRALAHCWATGRTLGEGARRSPLRRALTAVAERAVSG